MLFQWIGCYFHQGLLSCCYNSSPLRDNLCNKMRMSFMNVEHIRTMHTNTLKGVSWSQSFPISISISYLLALVIYWRTHTVIFVDFSNPVFLCIPLKLLWSMEWIVYRLQIVPRAGIYLRIAAAVSGEGGTEVPHTVDSKHDQ